MMGAVAMLLLAIDLGGCGQSEIDVVYGMVEPVQMSLLKALSDAIIIESPITPLVYVP